MAASVPGANADGGGASKGNSGRCGTDRGAGRPWRSGAGADRRGRGSGGGHAARGLAFRPRVRGGQEGRSLNPPKTRCPADSPLSRSSPQTPLCSCPRPGGTTASGAEFPHWLNRWLSRLAPGRLAWYCFSCSHWSHKPPLRPLRDVIAWPLQVPGSSSGKPRVLPGSHLCP